MEISDFLIYWVLLKVLHETEITEKNTLVYALQ